MLWETSWELLNAELNPICHLLALAGAHHFVHVSRLGVHTLFFSWSKLDFIVSDEQSRRLTKNATRSYYIIMELWEFFLHDSTSSEGVDLPIVETLRSQSETPQSIQILLDGWLARRRGLYLKTHKIHKRATHPCLQQDSNRQSQQPNGRRLTPYTARPPGQARIVRIECITACRTEVLKLSFDLEQQSLIQEYCISHTISKNTI